MKFTQVNVSRKKQVHREAVATGRIRLRPETIQMIKDGKVEKGDPLALAELSAILAVKKTPELITLAHTLKIEGVAVSSKVNDSSIEISVTVHATEKTGVEMEALLGVCAALLNIWDAVKQYEKDEYGQYPYTEIDSIRVIKKVKGNAKTS